MPFDQISHLQGESFKFSPAGRAGVKVNRFHSRSRIIAPMVRKCRMVPFLVGANRQGMIFMIRQALLEIIHTIAGVFFRRDRSRSARAMELRANSRLADRWDSSPDSSIGPYRDADNDYRRQESARLRSYRLDSPRLNQAILVYRRPGKI